MWVCAGGKWEAMNLIGVALAFICGLINYATVITVCVCFGQYNILFHLINPANHSHSLVLGVHLNWNDWLSFYPTSPPPL